MFPKKKRKTKKTEREKAKDRAWKACSAYIRSKECLETTNTPDWGICCSCNSWKHIKDLQAGHYIGGRRDNILFIDDIIHIQCIGCNYYKQGNYLEYKKYMINRYGEEKVERLENMKWIKKSLSLLELKALEQDYKNKLRELRHVYFEK